MRKLFLVGMASAFAVVAFGFSPTKHTNVLTRAGVTYVQRGALGSADYVATNVAMSAADVNALPNNETQLLANPAFTNAVLAIGGGGGGGGAVPNNALVLSDNVVKTVGGTNALPKEINAVSASEFARPWKQYNGYQRLDTVSYGGKIWVCAENHSGEEVFNEDGHWMDLVSNSVTDKSWVRWHRKWVDDNYAPRGGDVSFGSVQASSVSVGYQGTGTVSANLSGGATIGSGKTLAVNNGATFTIGGSNFNTVVGNAIDEKVLAATNAVVDQVHRITATNGMSAIDGDLGIYDANGHEYDAQNVQGLHYFLNYDANGSPYWTANYKGASWDYHFKIQFVSGELWHTECPELSIDRTDMAGEENDATLYFREPIGVLYKTAMRKPVRHGSVVPNYTKVAGKPLTNDVALGTLTIQGQTYDGTSDKTISIETRTSTNDVCNIVTNDVSGFTPWTTGNHYHNQYLNVTNVGMRYVNGKWGMHLLGSSLDGTFDNWFECAEDPNSFYTDPNATFVREYYVFGTGLTSTRTAIPPRNALGLAYLRDVPSTNSLISRVEANDKFLENKYLESWFSKAFSWSGNDLCFFANLVAEGWGQYQIATFEGHVDLPTYLASTAWHGSNKSLTDYGITNSIPSTNGFVTAAITNDVLMKSGGMMGDNAVINFNGGTDTVGYDGIYFSAGALEWADGTISTYGTTVTLDNHTSVSVGQWSSISSSSTGDTLPQYLSGSTVTNGGAKAYADATFAPSLTGVRYDFANGSNFTLRLYATLTNLIDRLGGSITNAPAL